ncbi:MAG TPA: HlyD family secretion protein [Candidatus Binataceae bacterium]|nr:HlyD family secretion protein [Candidatus Binataceae bacterium]
MKSPWLRRALLAIVIVAALLAIAPAIHYYDYYSTHVSTDDAYVDGTVALVSTRVAGTVSAVYVEDNWTVKRGDLLVTLDPSDFQVRVNQAQAQLARAKQTVDEMFAQVKAAQAGLSLADSQAKQAKLDYDRAEKLRKAGIVSNEFYDQAVTALKMGDANVALAQHEVAQANAALGEPTNNSATPVSDVVPQHSDGANDDAAQDEARQREENLDDDSRYDRPVVQQARAALQQAKLDLAYTRITAPFDGMITHKSVHVGHRVQPGEPLMADVPMQHLYVIANFKETQLTYVRVGQKVNVEADIYPGFIYHGHIDSISMGTGAAFSLLPPENATGNWVKVVQRIPVKIVLDDEPPADKPMRLGLSVEASVDVSDTQGPLLASIIQRHYTKDGQVTPNENLPPPALSEEHGEESTPQHRHMIRNFLHELRHPKSPRPEAQN